MPRAPFYVAQLERISAWAKADGSQLARATLGIARTAVRTQPEPDNNTQFSIVGFERRDAEILPRFLSKTPDPAAPRMTELCQRSEWKGVVSVEAALSSRCGLVAIPTSMLEVVTGIDVITSPIRLGSVGDFGL